MAKKAVEKTEELEDMLVEEVVETERPKTGNLSEPKSDGISIQKYLQLYGSEIHAYSRAYLREQFRGIIKSKEAWKVEINKIMEGKK